ncbi:MAG: lysophospholipid acyltransferase family protein [Desulfobacterales bacterium]|nr:lysophospholipid acyltransferase family protein [Desulfobacterales bacterium]
MYKIIKLIFKIISMIHRSLMTKLAYPIGMIWYKIDRRHREIATNNMIIAFGSEWSIEKINKTVKANFVQLSRVALELFSLLRVTKENLDSYIVFSGEEHLYNALSKGKGIIILTAHLGNWELMAISTPLKFNITFNVMGRALDYKPMDKMINEIRTRTGNIVVDKNKSADKVASLLRENKIIGILMDQHAAPYEGVYVPFFGKIDCSNKGVALFAMRYGAIILPAFNIRQEDGRYKVIFDQPIEVARTGDLSKDLVENTANFNKIIEKYIRMAPDNWFWVHRRWKE